LTLRALYILVIFAAALLPLNAHGAEMTLAKDEVGQLWIQIIGRIDDADDLKFKSILVDAIHRGEQITDVATFSQGGLTLPAINIGKYIRMMHLRTVAPSLVPVVRRHICYVSAMNGPTTMLEFDPVSKRGDERCTCAAECFLMWAAGSRRSGTAVQLHRLPWHGEGRTESLIETEMHTNIVEVIDAYLREMGVPVVTIARISSIGANELAYLTKDELSILTSMASLPWLKELFSARCSHHAATSPAELKCENQVFQELYWNGVGEVLSQKE
jgi:hypothetical protein